MDLRESRKDKHTEKLEPCGLSSLQWIHANYREQPGASTHLLGQGEVLVGEGSQLCTPGRKKPQLPGFVPTTHLFALRPLRKALVYL